MTKPIPDRVLKRPLLDQWDPDEPMKLPEAAALLGGVLSETGLRTAIRLKELAVSRVSGKLFTTRRALTQMLAPRKTTAVEEPLHDETEVEAATPGDALLENLHDRIARARAATKGRQRVRGAQPDRDADAR